MPQHAERTYLLGVIVEQGAYLEFIASQFAWSLIGLGARRGEMITKRMSLSQILRLLEDLAADILPQDLRAPAKDAIAQARHAVQKRNEFVHSMWMEELSDEGTPLHGRLQVNRDVSKSGEYTLKNTPLQEISEAIATLQAAHSALGRVWMDAGQRLGFIR